MPARMNGPPRPPGVTACAADDAYSTGIPPPNGHVLCVRYEGGESTSSLAPGKPILGTLIEHGLQPPVHCGGNGACGACRVQIEEGVVPPPTLTDRRHLTPDELGRRIRLACQLRPRSGTTIRLPETGKKFSWWEIGGEALPPPNIPAGIRFHGVDARRYGIAADVGTSRIRLSLWDVARGRRLRARASANPLLRYGSDVLSRLAAAAACPSVAQAMMRLAGEVLADLIADITAAEEVAPSRVAKLTVVANTATLTLLTGCDPHCLLQPVWWNRPIDCRPADPIAWKNLLRLDQGTMVHVMRPIAGFVGSDLAAAVVASGLHMQDECVLLIDFGTNSEIALWDGRTLWVTSAAGGPAFDGCGLSCGMPADTGAIHRVAGDPSSGFDCRVIGDGIPLGICGSGLVDAVALLLATGRLRSLGRFGPKADSNGATIVAGPPAIVLTHRDIDTFQRAKAAIGAGVACLLAEAGLSVAQLRRVFVCGDFGGQVDTSHATAVGLLPPLPPDRFTQVTNAALIGAETLLLTENWQQMANGLRRQARMVDLTTAGQFEALFAANLHLAPMKTLFGGDGGV